MTQVIDFIGGEYRNRTGVHGFAIRCVTTPPTRRLWCGGGIYQGLGPCKSRNSDRRDEIFRAIVPLPPRAGYVIKWGKNLN